MEYSEIIRILDAVATLKGRDKVRLVADFLRNCPEEMILPVVRLMTGSLWPSWESKEMRAGPQALLEELAELAGEKWRRPDQELGALTEQAIRHRTQNPLTFKPLDALQVYQDLLSISQQSGYGSESRRASILRGLLIEATPAEGKYLARTLIGGMLTGMGPSLLITAIAKAFGTTVQKVKRCYQVMPELGLVALAACRRELEQVSITPTVPVRFMKAVKVKGMEEVKGPIRCTKRYGGLRVQVHRSEEKFQVYTARLKNITSALVGLKGDIMKIDHSFVIEAELVGFQNGEMLDMREMVIYINRRHLSRRSSINPCLKAQDLLFFDGEDLTSEPYQERRRQLAEILRPAETCPFPALSLAQEIEISELGDLSTWPAEPSFKGLILHHALSPYTPGEEGIFLLRGRSLTICAAILEAEYGTERKSGILTRYKLGLRKGEGFAPVGWVTFGLPLEEMKRLTEELLKSALYEEERRLIVVPKLVLKVVADGVDSGQALLRPRISEIKFNASLEDVDPLEKLYLTPAQNL